MSVMDIVIVIIVVCTVLFALNTLAKRERALDTTKLITVLEYMDHKLPITQNSYLFLDEKHDVFFYLNDELLETPDVFHLKNRTIFTFDKEWERTIINVVYPKLKEMEQKEKAERQEKKAKRQEQREKFKSDKLNN